MNACLPFVFRTISIVPTIAGSTISRAGRDHRPMKQVSMMLRAEPKVKMGNTESWKSTTIDFRQLVAYARFQSFRDGRKCSKSPHYASSMPIDV